MAQSIFAGDDTPLEFTVYQSDGTTPLDLTNVDIVWGLAPRVEDGPLITKDSTNTGEIKIVSAVDGRFDVLLSTPDTDTLGGQDFYHEVEITDANGDEFTVFTGLLAIKRTMID